MATKNAETSLKSFLKEATLAYAEDAYTEKMVEEGLIKGEYESGRYVVEDTFRVSPDNRVFSGREEVFLLDDGHSRPIWTASYHGAILPRRKPEPILEAYKEVLKEPHPELPIRGPRYMKMGGYEYTFGSTHGPLSIARFAVIEELRKSGARVYRGDIAGGWVSG